MQSKDTLYFFVAEDLYHEVGTISHPTAKANYFVCYHKDWKKLKKVRTIGSISFKYPTKA